MAIATYAELRTSVARWTVRSDLASRMDDIVALAEADIRQDVRCQAMETLATGALTGETLAWPTRFLAARRLKVGNYVQTYVTPAEYADYDQAGTVKPVFTTIGQSLYILNGASGDAYSLIYWAGFAPFADDADTNWLLLNAPDVYLWACCLKVAILLKDDSSAARWGPLYQAAVQRLNAREKMAASSGSPLEIRSTSREC